MTILGGRTLLNLKIYDDFEADSIDVNKWTVSTGTNSSVTILDGSCLIKSYGSDASITSKQDFKYSGIVQLFLMAYISGNALVRVTDGGANTVTLFTLSSDTGLVANLVIDFRQSVKGYDAKKSDVPSSPFVFVDTSTWTHVYLQIKTTGGSTQAPTTILIPFVLWDTVSVRGI